MINAIYIATGTGSGYTLSSYSTGSIDADSPMGRPALKIACFTPTELVITDESDSDTTFTLTVEFRGQRPSPRVDPIGQLRHALNHGERVQQCKGT